MLGQYFGRMLIATWEVRTGGGGEMGGYILYPEIVDTLEIDTFEDDPFLFGMFFLVSLGICS